MPRDTRRLRRLLHLALASALVSTACSARFRQDLSGEAPLAMDRVHWYAELAHLAYEPDSVVHVAHADSATILDVPSVAGRVLLLTDSATRTHVISIRGTANVQDALLDAEYSKRMDVVAHAQLHRGFEKSALAVHGALRDRLLPGYRINLTGHSLGGAAAAILMMYYHEEGRTIGEVVTFGQPKVTNHAGAERYAAMPLLRVVDCRDPVPLVPPRTLVSSLHGAYRHFGTEMILSDGPHYVFLSEHDAERSAVSSFWDALPHIVLADHHMPAYLTRIGAKLGLAERVPYADRDRYPCTAVPAG